MRTGHINTGSYVNRAGIPAAIRGEMNRKPWKRKGRSWRSDPEYHAAIKRAFTPFMVGEEYCRCAFSGEVLPLNELSPCHILGAGAHPELKMDWRNILPGSFKKHFWFDQLSPEKKKAVIEKIIPGRWEELEQLSREHFQPKESL